MLEQRDAAINSEWREVLESVNFLSSPDFQLWGRGQNHYFGTELPAWTQHANHADVTSLLYWLDAVIDFHGGAFVAVMAKLKRLGICTVASLHILEMSAQHRQVGHTNLAMAYEHAFDVFSPWPVVVADWLHGMGGAA